VVEVVEDGQGLLPGVAGGVEFAGGVVDVAEVVEGVGLAVAGAEVPVQGEGVPVADDGLGVLAEVVMGVAEADQNDDDTFITNIRYAWVPRSRFSSVSEISGTVADTSGVRRNVTAGTAVIRGFSFNNTGTGGSGDDHIRELGVMTNPASIDIYYGDDDPTDSPPWTYRVRYVNLA